MSNDKAKQTNLKTETETIAPVTEAAATPTEQPTAAPAAPPTIEQMMAQYAAQQEAMNQLLQGIAAAKVEAELKVDENLASVIAQAIGAAKLSLPDGQRRTVSLVWGVGGLDIQVNKPQPVTTASRQARGRRRDGFASNGDSGLNPYIITDANGMAREGTIGRAHQEKYLANPSLSDKELAAIFNTSVGHIGQSLKSVR